MSDSEKPKTDASFAGLMSFSSRPPPPEDKRDVHAAPTQVGEMPAELLASLRGEPPTETDSNGERTKLETEAKTTETETTETETETTETETETRATGESVEATEAPVVPATPPSSPTAALAPPQSAGTGKLVIAALVGAVVTAAIMWFATQAR